MYLYTLEIFLHFHHLKNSIVYILIQFFIMVNAKETFCIVNLETMQTICKDRKADLTDHFSRDNSICDICGLHTENAFNFFFRCPEFTDYRFNLVSFINEMQFAVPLSLTFLVHGEKSLSVKTMKTSFKLFKSIF